MKIFFKSIPLIFVVVVKYPLLALQKNEHKTAPESLFIKTY